MAASNFATDNKTYTTLMSGMYRVPRYQRDYSWDVEQWEDLWADLLSTMPHGAEEAHYMGYLVLRAIDSKTYEVIDGQQRLTTLSIVVLAVLKNLEQLLQVGRAPSPEESQAIEQRLLRIREKYIGAQDPVTLLVQPRLTLNRNNADYFAQHLATLGTLPRRHIRASNTLLRRAFEWFVAKIGSWLQGRADPSQALARFVEEMADCFFFTVIVVTDELNAYRVFETLNARGVKLSPTDLLKNYLFSVLSSATENREELDVLERRWEALVDRLGDDNFPQFVRAHWNSRHGLVRQADLFKRVRASVQTREAAFALIRALEEDLDPYLELIEPEASASGQSWRRHAQTLKIFQVRQPLPLLLASRRVLGEQEFEALLRACVVISFRYNVIGGLSPGEQERAYVNAATKVANGELKTVSAILHALREVYPSDKQFTAAFIEKSMTTGRNSRIVKYILGELEAQLSNTAPDLESDRINIEHVLPQAPSDEYPKFSAQEAEDMVNRLGNVTLLSTSRNRDLGNASYEMKRAAFAESEFELTKRIASEYSEWTPATIVARQQRMASYAVARWRVPQLDG